MSTIFLQKRPKILRVDVNLCTGCQSCVMACSLTKEGSFSTTKSRIQIHTDESKCYSVPNICEHCIEPPCINACPVNAIIQLGETGIVKIDEDICTGCSECKEACPFDSIQIRGGKAYKCDLCDGDPACTKTCYSYALQYVEKQPATKRGKTRLAKERLRALASLTRQGATPRRDR